MKLSELAGYVDTDVVRVLRDYEVHSAELCAAVRGPEAVTYLEKEKFLPSLRQEGIAAVICREEMVEKLPAHVRGVLVSDAPKFGFCRGHNYFAQLQKAELPPTQIGPGANISPTACISPVGVRIRKKAIIEPGVIIQLGVRVGDSVRVVVRTVLGSTSFSPFCYRDRAITLLDRGSVVIGDDVEIRSLCSIEWKIFEGEETVLSNGVKIDQLVLVGHGTRVGRCTFIAGNTMICGKCTIGESAWLGASATLSNRIKIGDGARVSLGAVVTADVPAGATVSGNFAIEHRQFLRNPKASLADGQTAKNRPLSPDGQKNKRPCGLCVAFAGMVAT